MPIRPRRSLLSPELQRPSALKSHPRDPGRLWLDKNENLDPQMVALAAKVLASLPPLAVATYPEAGEAYRKLARWVGVEPDCLLLTPGSDGAIRLVFEAFVEPGDVVMHTVPTFAMYPVYSQMFGARVRPISYGASSAGPQLDLSAILDGLRDHQPKLLCLPNPDSPTGTVVAPEALRQLLEECERSGTVLLVDEAYHPFHAWSAMPWIRDSRHLIVARTLAKAWGSAGVRLGYCAAHPETALLLHKMRPMYEVSTLAVEFLSRMLDHAPAMQESVARVNAGKDFFALEMRRLGFPVLPTAGNFVHVAFGPAGPAIHRALADKVLYRQAFSDLCLQGYSRFTVAPEPIMRQLTQLIEAASRPPTP